MEIASLGNGGGNDDINHHLIFVIYSNSPEFPDSSHSRGRLVRPFITGTKKATEVAVGYFQSYAALLSAISTTELYPWL